MILRKLSYWLTYITVMILAVMTAGDIPLLVLPFVVVAWMLLAGLLATTVQERFGGHCEA